MRTPTWCRKKAAGIGPAATKVIEAMLAENALHRLRSAQGVIGLADKHQPTRLEAACAKAIAAGDPSYRTIKGILAAGLEDLPADKPTGDGGAAAFLHGPDQLFAGSNVIPLPTAVTGPAAPGATMPASGGESSDTRHGQEHGNGAAS
jgi:hypothetical protein